ncbi:DNA glycosylase [Rhodotorula sp. JG-1b]|nr:DNA glycosylase [Rhodotorula sp. JG-1b]
MSCLATPLRLLPVTRSELHLASTLPSGQSFRWHRLSPPHATLPDGPLSGTDAPKPVAEGAEEWAFGWADRTVVLRQDDNGIHYRALYPSKPPHEAYLADLETDTTRSLLRTYFQLDTPLEPLYADWSTRDPKFDRKIQREKERLGGIRVLRQNEWETLVSFICSANNNIARITLMVNRLCAALGDPLPHPSHFSPASVHTSAASIPADPPPPPAASQDALSLFSFPPPKALAQGTQTEALLRQLGFGYRANFIPWSAAHLLETAAALDITPEAYLSSLTRKQFSRNAAADDDDDESRSIRAAREKLLEFKGVGRKVADCILLFGLGWSETVPVDTHVFQIAVRDYSFPAAKNANLSPALHDKVSEFLADKWGPYAGWAQQILFFADLKSGSTTLPTKAERTGDGTRRMTVKVEAEEELTGSEAEEEAIEKVKKLTFEEEVAALIANPGTKRRRSSATPAAKVQVERVKAPARGLDDEDERGHARLRIKEVTVDDDQGSPATAQTRTRPPLKQRRTNSAASVRKSRSRSGTIKEEE